MAPQVTAAEALIQTALLGEAIDDGPALIFIADDEMRYIAVNECACRTLGYTRDELLALRVDEVAQEPDARDAVRRDARPRLPHGTSVLTRKDGTTVEFLYRASKTQLAGMNFFVSVGFVDDELALARDASARRASAPGRARRRRSPGRAAPAASAAT